ncbi:outer membrane beta-barrel protein [Ferruginibacter profundus]
MLKLPALLIGLLCLSAATFGQTITVSGSLKDNTEKKSVKNAVVALVRQKDSVLYKFTRTDNEGNFALKNVLPGNYTLLTTHPLYADYVDSITIKDAETRLGSIGLINKSKLLQEVIVKSGNPIRIKGDTTIYTADSFKVKDGASVEDLLRKMPGFQVGKDGQLKAQGETVKNVLVDGEEFFGSDPGMALKNLQANTVQEVQVYDKKSDQATFTGIDDGIKEKTVNLKLKNNKKQGYFGKIEAGGGTPDNYSNSAMLNAFKDKRKLSAFGFMSNTGRTDLGWQDAEKFGGGEMDGMTSGMDDDGNTWYSYSSNGNNNGIPKNWNGGIHYSNKYMGDSLNINGSYRYAKVYTPGGTQTFSKTYLPDTSWLNNSRSTSFNNSQKHTMNFTLERKLDSNNTIKFVNRGGISHTESSSNYYEESLTNQNDFINNSTRKTSTKSDAQNYQGTLSWNHKFKKARRTFSATADANINHTDSKTFLYSLNNFYKGSVISQKDTTDQETINKADSKTFTVNMAYTEPLNKYLSLGINSSTAINNSSNNRDVMKNDGVGNYTNKVDSLSNNFDFNRFVQRNGLSLRIVKKKFSGGIGAALAFNSFKQNNISKGVKQDYDFTTFFPNANFNIKLKGNKNLRFNYNGNAQAPSLQQLQPLTDNSNPLSVVIGNPDLKQSFTNNFSGGLQWYKPLSDNALWSYFSYSTTSNAFSQYNRIDTMGRNVYQTVNVNGNKNFYLNIDYNFSVGKGKKKIGLGFGPNIEFNRNNDFVNGIKNTNNTTTYSMSINMNKYVENKFDFYISPRIAYSQSTSSINSSSNTNFWMFTGWAQGSIYLKKNLSINTNANFNFRQKDPRFPQNNNYTKWNADIKKYVYKKEISVKFGINDILNQNRGYERNFSTYKFTESYYNTLKRYWLLTLTWEFTHNKKQAAAPAPAAATPIIK